MFENALDKKTKKSLLNLKYLSYIFVFATIALGYIVSTYTAYRLLGTYSELKTQIILWLIISYVVSFMIIWGIYDVIRLLNNLYKGNIFTYENADILKIIDKKIIFTIIFSTIANVVMTLLNGNPIWFLLVWFVFIIFLVVGHILVYPLALLVRKSADLQIEMELTIW